LDVEAPHIVDPMIVPVYALILSFDCYRGSAHFDEPAMLPASNRPPTEAVDEAVRCS
jgi:hypothetical protein